MTPVSLRPSDFSEGGAVPIDRNLTWKDCRFNFFNYPKKDGTHGNDTTAALIHYVDDDGNEYDQQYSVGDPARFSPSKDGKSLVPATEGLAISKSSNFALLMDNLVNAGFPEDRLSEDISTLNGLKTHNIGIPEPNRSGLKREPAAEGARPRLISVPDAILQLPGEKKGVKGKAAPAADSSSAIADGIAIVKAQLAKADSTTRQKVASEAIRTKKNATGAVVFKEEFQVALMENGYSIEGDEITKAE